MAANPGAETPTTTGNFPGARDDQLMFDSMPSAMPFIKAGKLRAVAVTTRCRASALKRPDVRQQ
ncbi:hypothetical protein AU476_34195 [Cupriavidus sp. UYMSc13B]|nr:hypothetical protein AU476_34195 [Cupriavidus sp. UYMSc13B]